MGLFVDIYYFTDTNKVKRVQTKLEIVYSSFRIQRIFFLKEKNIFVINNFMPNICHYKIKI